MDLLVSYVKSNYVSGYVSERLHERTVISPKSSGAGVTYPLEALVIAVNWEPKVRFADLNSLPPNISPILNIRIPRYLYEFGTSRVLVYVGWCI